ncbi:MAG: radical SAM protein [Desulfotignum sp.]|nr:radical SAM protein [Desulfotignum sp.]
MKKRRKPVRNETSLEQGAICKKEKGLTRVALVYPNTYRTGMSNLGFQRVYQLANQQETVACERVFLPGPEQAKMPAKSCETGLSLDRFDIILFSISFENDFVHLVQLLLAAGIPLRSCDRNHNHPLVAAGGVACFINPEPIAPFMDLFLLGEAECLVSGFFSFFHLHQSRTDLRNGLEQHLPGAYVPALHTPFLYAEPSEQVCNAIPKDGPFGKIRVQLLKNLDDVQTHTSVLTTGTAFKDKFLVEILKGCPHGCRFCTAGFIYRPPRIYPKTTIFAAMDKAQGKTDKIGLVGSAILDHPDIAAICSHGTNNECSLSFSSLRADKLDDQMIDLLAASRVKTATIAPEAGSERMRHIINKKMSQQDILAAVEKLVEKKILNLRLYFMIGLPFEIDKDIEAIVRLTQKIKERFLIVSQKKGRMGTITLRINPFIPKPGTPFQWAAMADGATLRHRIAIIRKGLKKTPNVTVNIASVKTAKINALLSLGDRHTADVLETACRYGWARALKEHQGYVHQVVYTQKQIPCLSEDGCNHTLAAPLPWQILDQHISLRFLAKEWHRAQQEKQSAACPMIDCRTCRVCMP